MKQPTQRKSRTRNYATIVYPESAPGNWIEKIKDMHIPCLISPLHDKDINPNGEPKKPHYHVLFIFDSVKDFEKQVKPIFETIGAVGHENINSLRGYARYLCHLDNPEKAQYNINEVQALNGANYNSITLLPSDTTQMLKDIFQFIDDNDIDFLSELIKICAKDHEEWFELITTQRAYIVDKYIKSRCHFKTIQQQKISNTSEHELQRVLALLNGIADDKKKDIEQLLRYMLMK